MAKDAKPLFPNLLTGQNDTRIEEGLELPRWRVCKNTRFKTGAPTRRPGMRRLAVAGTDAYALDFDAASSEYIQFPAHAVHALTPPFTMEILINPGAVTGTQALAGFLHATAHPFGWELSGTTLVSTVTKSGGGSVTLSVASAATIGETLYARLTCNSDGDLELYANDSTTADDSSDGALDGETLIAAGGDMTFGRRNDGSYYDGKLCYFRCMKYVQPDSSMAFTRWPTPRASYMRWDYGGEIDTNSWVHDRSQYENHGVGVNSPGQSSALCVNPAPVQLFRSRIDRDNKTKLLVVAGGRVHDAEV